MAIQERIVDLEKRFIHNEFTAIYQDDSYVMTLLK